MRVHEAGWDMTANARLQSTLRALREGATSEWTMPEFVQYLTFYKRRSKKTCDLYRRQLEFMARHPVAPVQIHGTRAEIIESFSMYVTVREQLEGTKPTALKGDHQTVRALGAFLSIPDNVWPVAPRSVRTESRWVPSPSRSTNSSKRPSPAARATRTTSCATCSPTASASASAPRANS